jgi:hypothetical protein
MPATLVEVVITLPSNAKGAGSRLLGEGRVVRSFSCLTAHRDDVFAVTFTRACLERSDRMTRR